MSVVPGLIPRPHRPGLGEARTGARALSAVSLHNVPSWENVSPLGMGKRALAPHCLGLGENAWNKNLAWEKGREAPIKLPAETSGHVSSASHEFLLSRDVVHESEWSGSLRAGPLPSRVDARKVGRREGGLWQGSSNERILPDRLLRRAFRRLAIDSGFAGGADAQGLRARKRGTRDLAARPSRKRPCIVPLEL